MRATDGSEMNGYYKKHHSEARVHYKYHNRRAVQAHGLRRRNIGIRHFILAMLATVCMILICTLSYCSIRTSASSGFKYYTSVTVEKGMTLWSLADEYIDYDYYKDKNSYISEVKYMNHLDEDCSITEGQILILPYYSIEYIP